MAAGKKTGGRVRGTPNRTTADIRALAQSYTPAAMTELARLSVKAESETARVAAIKELFDRGYGKSRQPVDLANEDGKPLAHTVIERRVVDPPNPDS